MPSRGYSGTVPLNHFGIPIAGKYMKKYYRSWPPLELHGVRYVGKSVGVSFKKARFPIPSWNHYESILTGGSTTNNNSEGANSVWAHSLPTNASLWTVLATFREVRIYFSDLYRIYFCDLYILLIFGKYS